MIYKNQKTLRDKDSDNPKSPTPCKNIDNRGKSNADDSDSEANDEYSLEDEDDDTFEDFDDGDIDITDEDDDKNTDDKYKEANDKPTPWKLLLKMMLNPIEGWKCIRRSKESAEDVSAKLFYPMAAASAASCFFSCLYDSSITLTAATIEAVKIFVSLFFGNFLILMLERVSMPGKYKGIPDTPFGKEFVIYALTTLAIFNLLYQALPMIGPVLAFLPLWTIYLVIRGARFFKFPSDKKHLCITLICLYIVGAPIAVYWIFDMIL